MNSSNRVWIIDKQQRYRIEKRLGGGGMGDVYLAIDTRLRKSVALKLLKASLASDPEMKMRFEREMAICAALKSQHIVQVSDYGLTVNGHPFYVMEYLQGQTLWALLRLQARQDVLQMYHILSQVCAGLQVAHDGIEIWNESKEKYETTKVIHRDLKPANIFLEPTALGNLVKIIDFGIAKIRSFQVEHTNVTNTFLGTFHYAAPEQLNSSQHLDHRADIYSLGMIMYEMLSGYDPFGFNYRRNQVRSESWLVAHVSKPPIPLRSQPMCEHLSPTLEAIVSRCLEKSPQARFPSVNALMQALHSVVTPSTPISLPSAILPPLAAQTKIQPSPTQSPTIDNRTIEQTVSQHASQEADGLTLRLAPKFSRQTTTQPPSPSNRKSLGPFLFHWTLAAGGVLATVAIAATSWIKGLPEGGNFRSGYGPVAGEVQVNLASASHTQHVLDKTLTGHADMVWSVALSFDEDTAFSSGADKTIKAWDIDTGQLIQTFMGHTAPVVSVSLSPDEQTLVSSSSDAAIKLWDVRTGALIRTLIGHENTVWAAVISPDSDTLASASADHTVRIWNVDTGQLINTLEGHTDWVFSVAFSPDGRILASAGKDGAIRLWDAKSGELLNTLDNHDAAVRAIAFNPLENQLVSASWDRTLKLWDSKTGKVIKTFTGHQDRVVAVAFFPTGDQFVSGSVDHTVRTWATHESDALESLSGHSDWVVSVAISSSGDTLLSGGRDKTLRIWRQ